MKPRLNQVVTTVENPINALYGLDNKIREVADADTKAGTETGGAQVPPPPVDEKAISELIKSAFATEATSGALSYFKDKKLTETSFAQNRETSAGEKSQYSFLRKELQ